MQLCLAADITYVKYKELADPKMKGPILFALCDAICKNPLLLPFSSFALCLPLALAEDTEPERVLRALSLWGKKDRGTRGEALNLIH